MTSITFYEKPGCATNARQRKTLEAAGHQLTVKSLLTEAWTADRLLSFLSVKNLAEVDRQTIVRWFNPAAPKIKSGAIQPEALNAQAALQLLLTEPLLIRRPLLEFGKHRLQGFDLSLLRTLQILPAQDDDLGSTEEIEACSHYPPPSNH